ncbi:MAG: cytochrome c maturation protein CcmE [Alphaproteobacteria bacterium]|nr:cytochrome c maturation protein CcmE [Alphaproteobacteria bacterium]MBV8548501.1 cytochrome c maturation protein CcmE [Alphaproteobacteria bacterium]
MKPLSKKQARLYGLLLFLAGLATATTLVLNALGSNISYFRTPTEVVTGVIPEKQNGRGFRLGGLVEKGSLSHEGTRIRFRVTDMKNSLMVTYDGTVPDLFREGQGVVAEGRINASGVFEATQLLAKHDEKYQPPEVTKALRDAGHPDAVAPAESTTKP